MKQDNQSKQHPNEQKIDNPQKTAPNIPVSIDSLVPSVAKVTSRSRVRGVLTVVKTPKNGCRLSPATELYKRIGEPESVQIGFKEGKAVISAYLGEQYTNYLLREQGAKRVIYNKELVEQFVEHFELDFSDRTSITFSSVSYQDVNGNTAAIISLVK